jgi:hypothetical protein
MSSVPSKPHPRSQFTPEEDVLLGALVRDFGEEEWALIAKCIPHRNERQCKDRWFNYLSPAVQSQPWTPNEDLLLLDKIRTCGAKWVRLAAYFPGRTSIQLKNRSLVLSRRRQKETRAIGRGTAALSTRFTAPFTSPFACDSIPPLRARTPQDRSRISPLRHSQAPAGATAIDCPTEPLQSLVLG